MSEELTTLLIDGPLSFADVREINNARCGLWHPGWPDHDADPWTGADWSNAMQGESGEAGNVVKKMRRLELGTMGRPSEADFGALREKLAEELADTLLYADLLATYYGIDLDAAVIKKFNSTSEEYGLPHRIEVAE